MAEDGEYREGGCCGCGLPVGCVFVLGFVLIAFVFPPLGIGGAVASLILFLLASSAKSK